MMKLVTAVVASASVASAYLSSPSPRTFAAPRPLSATRTSETSVDYTAQIDLRQVLAAQRAPVSLRTAEAEHGMPWKTSIDASTFQDEELLYMPFWEWQMEFLEENLTDLRVVKCTNGKTDFSFNDNESKKARIVNLQLTSNEYRKIRLTYYDAGDNTQVFNAVMYPDPSYNLPVLGIDLLAFNRKKYLAIVDFQPLHADEAEHDIEFSDLLKPIKESYENLSGRMSSKFYDETQFFSEQMLFSRFEDEKIISDELFPAFKQYVQTHLDLIRKCDGTADQEHVLERQQAYDTYSAARDPATGLFTAMFGQEWAMDYVHDFLFSMSKRPAPGDAPVVPFGAGGNPHAKKQGGGNPFAAGGNPHAKKQGGGNPFAAGANTKASRRQPALVAR